MDIMERKTIYVKKNVKCHICKSLSRRWDRKAYRIVMKIECTGSAKNPRYICEGCRGAVNKAIYRAINRNKKEA